MPWGAQDEEELNEARDRNRHARVERERLYRIRRFLDAYGPDGPCFTFAQAEELERKGADYHLAEQLATAGATPDQAVRILL